MIEECAQDEPCRDCLKQQIEGLNIIISEGDVLLESQKEEIEKWREMYEQERTFSSRFQKERDNLRVELESLKAIAELAVNVFQEIKSFPFVESNDDIRHIQRRCHLTQSEIERLQNGSTS